MAFREVYRCYSIVMLPGKNREAENRGGKVIMPPSALDRLSRLEIMWPMMFRLSNHTQKRQTHAGVHEFVAPEGFIYLPHWMMQNLLLQEGDLATIENAVIPVAGYAKFQPLSVDFLKKISNPKAVLENTLRSFACLTEGDTIAISYNGDVFEISVKEVRPATSGQPMGRPPAVSIIECDMQLDFDAPVGYVDPSIAYKEEKRRKEEEEKQKAAEEATMDVEKDEPSFQTFTGDGNRLDGKQPKQEIQPMIATSDADAKEKAFAAMEAAYNPMKLTFPRRANRKPPVPKSTDVEDVAMDSFEPFTGNGNRLKPDKK